MFSENYDKLSLNPHPLWPYSPSIRPPALSKWAGLSGIRWLTLQACKQQQVFECGKQLAIHSNRRTDSVALRHFRLKFISCCLCFIIQNLRTSKSSGNTSIAFNWTGFNRPLAQHIFIPRRQRFGHSKVSISCLKSILTICISCRSS